MTQEYKTTPDGHIWVFQYSQDWMNCAICGNVKRADGGNRPCKGGVKLREMEMPSPDQHKGEVR